MLACDRRGPDHPVGGIGRTQKHQILRTQPDEPLSFLFGYMQQAYPDECKAPALVGGHALEQEELRREYAAELATLQRDLEREREERRQDRNRFVAAMKRAENQHSNTVQQAQTDFNELTSKFKTLQERNKAQRVQLLRAASPALSPSSRSLFPQAMIADGSCSASIICRSFL